MSYKLSEKFSACVFRILKYFNEMIAAIFLYLKKTGCKVLNRTRNEKYFLAIRLVLKAFHHRR